MQNNSNILIYQNDKGNIKVDVKFEDETLWLSQAQIYEVFGKAKSTISEHIKAIFEEVEVDISSTVRSYRTVQTEEEYIKYKEQKKQLQKLESFKELEEDIKRLK